MRKHFCFPAVLISLVVTVAVLAACSGPVNRPEPPTQTAPGNKPVETSTFVAASPATGDCSLALLLPGQATDYSSLQAGVKEAADQNGCQLDVYAAEYHPEKMVAKINEADQKNVWGMIIKPIDNADVETAIQQTSQLGLPVIVIGADGLPAIQTNRVVPDFIDGARKAAGFVCRAIHEHGNIVQLVDSQIDGADGQVSKAFSDGIQTTCPEAKLTTVPVQGSEEDTAKKAMLQVLSANPDISAVFAYTESAMNGAVNANQEAGIMGVVTSEFGQEPETAAADPTRVVDAVLRASGSETGKAAVRAALAQANGAAAVPQIAVTMQISVSDIAFQLPPDPTARRITIGVILPDGADPFYQQVYRGMLAPARSLDNVTLKIRSGNNDPQRMIQELDWMVNAKVDAILLSPVEDPALLSAIDRVARSGTPLVTLGLELGMDKIISQISFDEYAVGYRAGEYLCAALGGKGTLADVYDSANPEKEAVRSRGLQDYQQENCPEVKIITQALPAGSEPACQGLQKFLSEAGPVAGIFAHSDKLGLCAAEASSTAFVIGIGASTEAIQSIKDGILSATLGQYPYEMGQIAMETTIEYLYGKPVEPNKPFPVNLITRDSLK
jgi:ribose transport system substrate-binding protein